MSIGVIFCRYPDGCPLEAKHQQIRDFTASLPEINLVWEEVEISDEKKAVREITDNDIEKLVIAGIQPGFLKNRISSLMIKAGKNPDNVFLVDYADHGLNGSVTISMAKSLINLAVKGIPYENILAHQPKKVVHDTLVIGGGIAGIQAALEIASSGHKVYLVEKTGTIGGHMAMFDKTFPTLDCAACILTPKMVEVGQHSNIELLTCSEVTHLQGVPGDFRVTVHKTARRVDLKNCIGCGICSEKCPSYAGSEFDVGTIMRKAIYIPFPQAVPNKYLIDAENCRYVQGGKCGVCAKVCPANCIDLDEKDQDVILNVGNIVVATGFKVFDAKKADRFGYGKYHNVITSLELERLLNASGPTGGHIRFRSQDKKGRWIFTMGGEAVSRIALIHCVGSRDENHNKYCSRVCCMYSLKMAHLIKEKLPEAVVHEFFIDMRAFGKGYEEFYDRIKGEGINFIRGKTAQVTEKDDKLIVRAEDILNEKLIELETDMVVLSVGLEPAEQSARLAKVLGLPMDNAGWYLENSSVDDTQSTYASGIYIAGACQGPKDIPDSVAQGSAAAAAVLRNIVKGEARIEFKDINLEIPKEEILEKLNSS
jgi:heterodisulfide reductase subunit A